MLFTWRPAADMGNGPRHEKLTLSPLGFQGPQRRYRTPQENAVLFTNSVPISGRADSRARTLNRKDNFLPRFLRRRPSEFRLRLPALVSQDLSPCPGWGILTPIPFRSAADKHELWLRFRPTSQLRTDFLRSLGPD
ncbi:hypothetical protein JTE90_029129 [Oedothorax gibbosus]|uniref:Uncharacterized protein n=1 Tax=Oedothorax gibbosus TaxID=931172 RepID=A0AAV6TKL7_9ARAC|nr:hypothetical protein JTE90_029129 [Oedothorax gibbosus]